MSQQYFGVLDEDGTDLNSFAASGDDSTVDESASLFETVVKSMHSNSLVDSVRGVAPHVESETLDWMRDAATQYVQIPGSAQELRRRATVGDMKPYSWILALALILFSFVLLRFAFRYMARSWHEWRVASFHRPRKVKKWN